MTATNNDPNTPASTPPSVIKPSGRVCLGDAKLVELQTMVETVCRATVSLVVVDLSAIQYMDSSGLGEILKLYQDCRKKGRKLVLAAIPPNLAKVLKSSKLDRVFTITATVEEALTK